MKILDVIGTQQEKARLVLDNILFVTDFSPASEVGSRYALALARHYHGKIYVVPAAAMDFVEAIADGARQKAIEQAESSAIRWVTEMRLSGQMDGVRHELSAGEDAMKVLPRLLQEQSFDLVINGAGCREGQTLLLEPTVAETIQGSQCPLLTIGSQFYHSGHGELKTIIYATDFSPESLEASRYAVSLAQEFQARLVLLHVVEGLEPTLLDERAQIAKPYKLWLGKLVPDELRLWCEVEFAVEFGRPAERILQAAWENHADLVVVGARGLDQLTSPGLNVRKVMCNAACPVLTVSGTLSSQKQERFWKAANAASESQHREIIEKAS
jgi:nucleotide-binding universal stress UspA family protein